MTDFEKLLKAKPKIDNRKIKFDYYFYRETGGEEALADPRLFIHLDWFKFEDDWRQRYLFDKPRYNPEEMEKFRIRNENRHKWFKLELNICGFRMSVEIRLQKIGNVYHGRLIDEEVSVKRWQERKKKREAKK